MEFTRLFVYDVDSRATTDDLTKLLGFDQTEYLQKWCCVQMMVDNKNEKYAKVICPSDYASDVEKFNGVPFFERKIRIVNADAPDAPTPNASTSQTEQPRADDEGEIQWMLLDCRDIPEFNFPPITEAEVCDALMIEHADDPFKGVKTFHGQYIGTFGIESNDMSRYVDKSVVLRGKQVNLTPMRKKQRQPQQVYRDPESIKIRIFDAYRTVHRKIKGDLFDEYFESLGVQIIKPTQAERCRDNYNFYNTNRYIVVKKTNDKGEEVDFGDRIQVSGIHFNLSYYNIQKFCSECERKHGWDCPTRARDKFLRQLRKGTTEKTKMYSDSTMRHVNQLALRTDVACMSGGGIAQICNMIPYDEPHNEVIINAGTNELKTDSTKEFVYTMKKTEEKLRKLSTATSVTVVLPQMATTTPELAAKSQLLRDTVKNIDSVKTILLEDVEQDETNHPTIAGTRAIIKQIDDVHEEKIILQGCQDDVTAKRRYRKVQAVFKVGCRGCDSMNYTSYLCDNCKVTANDVDASALEVEIERLRQEMFPHMEVDTDMDTDETANTDGDDKKKGAGKIKRTIINDHNDVNPSKAAKSNY